MRVAEARVLFSSALPMVGSPPPPRPDCHGGEARPRSGHRRGWWRAALVRCASVASFLAAAPPGVVLSAEGGPAPPLPPAMRERLPDGAAIRLLGRDVKGPSGDVVAQIANVLVDGAGQPVAAVLDYGGFMGVGRRRIAVAWRALRFAPGETPEGTITLGLTRDQLKDFPEAKRGEPVVAAAPAAAAGAPR